MLERPKHDGKAWVAKKNTHPISDLSGVRGRIRFTSNSGISATKGALGMSLQTPRQLAAADVELMLGSRSGATSKREPVDAARVALDAGPVARARPEREVPPKLR